MMTLIIVLAVVSLWMALRRGRELISPSFFQAAVARRSSIAAASV